MTRFLSCASLAAALLLAGCAALRPEGELPSAPAFDLLGRVAVRFEGRVFSSHLRWLHAAERDEIWLMAPTGQALAHITGDASGATLTAADGNEYQAADVESLMRRAMGWELPVSKLAWWVKGAIVPAGLVGEVLRDANGRLVRLRQDGWNITLLHPAVDASPRLPSRVELADDRHRIRLVIDRWRRETDAP